MDETGFTKLRITKGVNESMKDVLEQARRSGSIAQLAEDLLLEACESIVSPGFPTLLPTVVQMRMRIGLPITPNSNPLIDRDSSRGGPQLFDPQPVRYGQNETERVENLRVAEDAHQAKAAEKKPKRKA